MSWKKWEEGSCFSIRLSFEEIKIEKLIMEHKGDGMLACNREKSPNENHWLMRHYRQKQYTGQKYKTARKPCDSII